MVQIVTDRDGTQHRFPDNATPEQMKAALDALKSGAYQSEFADLMRERELAREVRDTPTLATEVGAVGEGVGRGTANFLGTPADLMAAALNLLGDAVVPPGFEEDEQGRPLPLFDIPDIEKPVMGADWIAQNLDALGMGTTPEPRSALGRILTQGAIDVGSALAPVPFARGLKPFLKPGGTPMLAAEAMATKPGLQAGVGLGSGLTRGGSQEIFPDSPVADLVSSLVGGLTVAGAVPAGTNLVQRLIRGGTNILGKQDPLQQASTLLQNALRRDQTTPAMVGDRMVDAANRGVPLSVVDAAGRNTLRLGDSTIIVPSAGSDAAADYLIGRQLDQGPRIIDQLDKFIADPNAFKQATDALMDQRKTAAAPLYQKAFEFVPDLTPRLQQFLDDPIVSAGLKRGIEIQRLEALAANTPFQPYEVVLNDLGELTLKTVPNFRALDAIKRGLDDILEGYRNEFGKLVLDERGRAIDQVRRAFVSHMDEINPDYRAAREAWAGPSEAMDAMWQGRTFANGDIENMAANFDKMAPSLKEFFRLGVSRELRSVLDKGGESADNVRRIFGSRDQQARLATIFPDAESFDAFKNAMGLERLTTSSKNFMLGNSATIGRNVALEDADTMLAQGAMDFAENGWRGVLSKWLRRGRDRSLGINEDTADELSKVLFSEDPEAVGRLFLAAPPRTPWAARTARDLTAAELIRQLGYGVAPNYDIPANRRGGRVCGALAALK